MKNPKLQGTGPNGKRRFGAAPLFGGVVRILPNIHRISSDFFRCVFARRVFRIKTNINMRANTHPIPYRAKLQNGVLSENLPSGGNGM